MVEFMVIYVQKKLFLNYIKYLFAGVNYGEGREAFEFLA